MGGNPVIIGLLGGIASGKSTVAEILGALGAQVIDADRIAHDVLRSPDVVPKIVDLLGSEVLDAAGSPDRERVGALVFGDPAKLERLEALLHPRIRERMRAAIGAACDCLAIVLDAPLLLEGGLGTVAEVLVFVEAPRKARHDRADEARNWGPDEIEEREAHQAPLREKRRRAEFTVRNDGSLEELAVRVADLYRRILAMRTRG